MSDSHLDPLAPGAAGDAEPRCASTSTGTTSPRERHAARLLALPDERLPRLRVPVRDLRRAGPQLRGRARPAPTSSTCRWWRSTRRCCCCRRSPTASRCSRCSASGSGATLVWLAITGAARRRLRRHRALRVRSPDPRGRGPQRSAFLSAFFTLVGTHGLHVTFGIVWLVTLMVQVEQARPDRREPPAPACACRCSGTSWTWSGSASSPSCT